MDGSCLFYIVMVDTGLTCGLILEIILDLDAGRWLWPVLDESCRLRIVDASFGCVWQVLWALDGSVRFWMVLAYFIL